MRNGGEAGNNSLNKALGKPESGSLEDYLVIHPTDLSRHKLIRDRDSGQIEALDRDYAKASSVSQSAPHSFPLSCYLVMSFGLEFKCQII